MATLTDLIASTSTLSRDTAWLVSQIAKMNPSADTLKLEASVVSDPIPAFRKKADGLIKIGDMVVGAGSGKGYLDGGVGPWTEMKPLIAAKLGGVAKVRAPRATAKREEAPVPAAEVSTEPAADPVADPVSYNEEMNEKTNGPVATRKTWINYAMEAKTADEYANAEVADAEAAAAEEVAED